MIESVRTILIYGFMRCDIIKTLTNRNLHGLWFNDKNAHLRALWRENA